MNPQWKHDCSACEFVGRMGHEDVYVCDKRQGKMIEVIIRHSDEGADYWSNGVFKGSKSNEIGKVMRYYNYKVSITYIDKIDKYEEVYYCDEVNIVDNTLCLLSYPLEKSITMYVQPEVVVGILLANIRSYKKAINVK